MPMKVLRNGRMKASKGGVTAGIRLKLSPPQVSYALALSHPIPTATEVVSQTLTDLSRKAQFSFYQRMQRISPFFIIFSFLPRNSCQKEQCPI